MLYETVVPLINTGGSEKFQAALLQLREADLDESASAEEKIGILSAVNDTLSDNESLVTGFGPDVLEICMEFFDSNWPYGMSIREYPGIIMIMKICDILARTGNPDKLFGLSCELLKARRFPQSRLNPSAELYKADFFLGVFLTKVRWHCLVELMVGSFRRIETFHPSETLSSLIETHLEMLQCHRWNLPFTVFYLRRLYAFLRDYTFPQRPDHLATGPEVEKENALQRHLLEEFLLKVIGSGLVDSSLNYTLKYYVTLQPQRSTQEHMWRDEYRDEGEYTVLMSLRLLIQRYLMLALSFDLDLINMFKNNCQVEGDSEVGIVESLSPFDEQLAGICILTAQSVSDDESRIEDLDFSHIITKTVQMLAPLSLENEERAALEDSLVYLLFVKLMHKKSDCHQIGEISVAVVGLLVKMLVKIGSRKNCSKYTKVAIFTVFTRLLLCMNEDAAWDTMMSLLEDGSLSECHGCLTNIFTSSLQEERPPPCLTWKMDFPR